MTRFSATELHEATIVELEIAAALDREHA